MRRNRFRARPIRSFLARVAAFAMLLVLLLLSPGGWERLVVLVVLVVAWFAFGSRRSALRIRWHMRSKGYRFLRLRDIAMVRNHSESLYRLPPYDEIAVTPVWTVDSWESLLRAVELYDQIDPEFEEFYEFAKSEAAHWRDYKSSADAPPDPGE